jgi:regulator of sigma E protease
MMLMNVLYIVLAAFGLGFLIFIHELGHYFMARREGMRIEAFGIGFGKPIFTWHHKGVKWNICCLPFGGYVRIVGMEKEGSLEPHQIPDGFFGRPPLARIKVALMGPLVNIIFAFLLFSAIWMTGGREKPFSEFTRLIGWVDPQSELYQRGVRPGDEITEYDQRSFNGFGDLLYAALLKQKSIEIAGYKINYENERKEAFDYSLESYPDPRSMDPSIRTVGVFSPARYLIYDRYPNGQENPLPEGSPMAESGIQYKDRIVWADGQWIFSMMQLSHVINEPKVLLTVKRGEHHLLARVPRLKVSDLRMSDSERAEVSDWEHEAGLKTRLAQLLFIPYSLSHHLVVENPLYYLNEQSEEQLYESSSRIGVDAPLEEGDQIIAVDGKLVSSVSEFLTALQQREISIIVEREREWPQLSWKNEDHQFNASVHAEDLQTIVTSIGTPSLDRQSGNLILLHPVIPKPLTEFSFYTEKKAWYAHELSERKKVIEEMENPEEKAQALRLLEDNQKKFMLGIVLQDLPVSYNPTPVTLFFGVFDQMWRTVSGLVTGYLSPKWMSGPIGIVQVFHYGWTVGVKEALFWMAVISLNLGIVNLLPLPVLDGGHILFSMIEGITKKPIKSKTMQRLVIPFVVLIIAAFIYFTYNDLARFFGHLF